MMFVQKPMVSKVIQQSPTVANKPSIINILRSQRSSVTNRTEKTEPTLKREGT